MIFFIFAWDLKPDEASDSEPLSQPDQYEPNYSKEGEVESLEEFDWHQIQKKYILWP